jgi:hypothetical protein
MLPAGFKPEIQANERLQTDTLDRVATGIDTLTITDKKKRIQQYDLTYLLTPWSRVLLEKLTVNFAASQEIPRIYETRKFLQQIYLV